MECANFHAWAQSPLQPDLIVTKTKYLNRIFSSLLRIKSDRLLLDHS